MAKAVYTFISYPDDVDTLSLELHFDALYLDWMHSPVHDSDISEKTGNPVKPHIHWYVGYAKKPMGCKEFIGMIKGVSPAISIDQRELVVRDPLAAYDYCSHKNNPNKAQYNEQNIVESESWCLSEYVTATQQKEHDASVRRMQKHLNKQEKLASISDVLKVIGKDQGQVSSFQGLVKWAVENGKLQIVVENSYFFRTYLDSYIFDNKITRKLEAENIELLGTIAECRASNEDLRERLEYAENCAALYYNQLFGEAAPESYEWGFIDDNVPLEGSPLEQIGMSEMDFQ